MVKKKIKKYKVGMKSEAFAISMVYAPAIQEEFISLSKEEELQQVFLEEDAKHIVYGAVLVPERDIYRNNGKNEYYISFSSDSIEKMSQDFMREYRQHEVKVDHKDIANEVCVVESWLKSDLYKDKSVALGLNENLPVGTWFCGMKVNNVETWNRIKNGELKGFSVESLLSLEEFEAQNNDSMINIDEMSFWTKMKEVLSEAFSKKEDEPIEPIDITDMEEQTPPPTDETPKVEEAPKVEETPKAEEPKAEEPKVEEPKTDEQPRDEQGRFAPKEDENVKHLEGIIASMKEEVEALKKMNNGLNEKINELSKEPSAKPINTNAKGNGVAETGVYSSTFQSWRETIKSMM